MTNLCDLTLHECDFSLVCHNGLAYLQNLTTLRIIDCINYKRLLSFLSPNLKILHLRLFSLHYLDTNALLSFKDLQHSRLEALSILVVINQAKCFDLKHLDLMPSLKHLNLNNVDLRDYDFNFEFFQHLESLSFRKTRVSELCERLSKLTSLKTLDVSSNYFLKLSPNIFTGLEKLENLYMVNMSHPEKTTSKQLTIGLFKPLKNLKLLALAGNRLKVINSKIFNFLPSLEMLDLSENQLSLGKNTFTSLKSLRFLDLSSNNLCRDRPDGQLEESIFLGLENLETLNLSENLIKTISRETFEGLERLESLSLSSNLFDNNFPFNVFEACTNLRRVDFSRMTKMSIATKTKLKSFYFQKIEFLF